MDDNSYPSQDVEQSQAQLTQPAAGAGAFLNDIYSIRADRWLDIGRQQCTQRLQPENSRKSREPSRARLQDITCIVFRTFQLVLPYELLRDGTGALFKANQNLLCGIK